MLELLPPRLWTFPSNVTCMSCSPSNQAAFDTFDGASRWFFRSTNRLSAAKLQEIKESKLRNVSKKIMQNCEEIKTISVVYDGSRFFRIWGLPFFSKRCKSTSPWPTFISGHPRSVLPGKALPTPSNIGELLNEHRERIIGIIGQCHVSKIGPNRRKSARFS